MSLCSAFLWPYFVGNDLAFKNLLSLPLGHIERAREGAAKLQIQRNIRTSCLQLAEAGKYSAGWQLDEKPSHGQQYLHGNPRINTVMTFCCRNYFSSNGFSRRKLLCKEIIHAKLLSAHALAPGMTEIYVCLHPSDHAVRTYNCAVGPAVES